MSDTAPVALVEITSEVVSAYLAQNHVPPAEIPTLITAVHAAFTTIGEPTPVAAEPEKREPAVPVSKSVTDEFIISLEDGKRYKTLKRHLSSRGLMPEAYRAKWSLPGNYPMVAPAYARQRSELAKTIRLGQQRRKR